MCYLCANKKKGEKAHGRNDQRNAKKVLKVLEDLCSVLGIETTKEEEILDEEIEKLIEERQAARKNKDFARADEIRDQLLEQGIVLKDTREGVKWSRA